jgi:hypothetical protein
MKKYVLKINEMAIVPREEMPRRKMEIDLSGPEGNAYALMGIAKKLFKQIYQDEMEEWRKENEIVRNATGESLPSPIDWMISDMTSGDYEHLLQVFDGLFGDYVTLYR